MDQSTAPNPPRYAPPATPKTCGLATWSLVLGIFSFFCFSILMSVPGVICGHMAQSRIKKSAGTLTGGGMAIAGLVLGYLNIVLAIVMIPMMVAIAIPNFVRARDTAMHNMCVNQLGQIDAAKHQWALEEKKLDSDIPTSKDLEKYLKDNRFPTCPKGGTYTIGPVVKDPVCSVPGHALSSP